MKRLLTLVVFGMGLWACNPSKNEPQSAGYEYFPLEKGNFTIYDVTEKEYALNQDSVTSTYQIKEVVADKFTSLDAQETFRIERYRRSNSTQAWAIDSVWTSRLTADKAIRTENGVPVVKLWFPAYENQAWNGNILNGNDPDEFTMKKMGQPLTVGTNNFPETVTVVEEEKISAIDFVSRKSVYAKSVGLVYRERIELYYCQSANCVGTNKIDFGTRFIQQISSYGKE